jgi:sugar/nucleoside kinase (ribokinase family)
MTVSLSVGTIVIGTANVDVTGQQINISQGTAEGIPNTIASVTGIGLNIAVGTVFAGGTSVEFLQELD